VLSPESDGLAQLRPAHRVNDVLLSSCCANHLEHITNVMQISDMRASIQRSVRQRIQASRERAQRSCYEHVKLTSISFAVSLVRQRHVQQTLT
jgi:hypothetical protein